MKKIKLDIIYGNTFSQIQGVNKVTESLVLGSDIFCKNNISLENVVSSDGIFKGECLECFNLNSFRQNDNNIAGVKKLEFSKKLKSILYQSCFLTYEVYKRKVIHKAKNVVDQYLKYNSDSNVIIFQDFLTAYFYLKKTKGTNNIKKTIFISHSTEDLFSQIGLSYPMFCDTKYENKIRKYQEFVLNNIDKIVFVSKQPLQIFRSKYGEEKVDYIYNGIPDLNENSKFKVEAKKFQGINFVSVGSVTYRKGYDMLIDAFLNVLDQGYDNFKLYIVGDGDLKLSLENKVLKAKANEHIVFLGQQNDIPSILADQDCYLLASRNEGLPIAILEALRQDLYIISTTVGGIPEMLENSCSKLIEPSEVELRKSILELLGNPSLLESSKGKGYAFYKDKFSLKAMIEKYSEVVFSVMK